MVIAKLRLSTVFFKELALSKQECSKLEILRPQKLQTLTSIIISLSNKVSLRLLETHTITFKGVYSMITQFKLQILQAKQSRYKQEALLIAANFKIIKLSIHQTPQALKELKYLLVTLKYSSKIALSRIIQQTV